jgi:tRNA(fMet)-specific endonuclease VapC
LHPRGNALWARIEADVLPRCAWLPIDADISIRTADMSARLRLAGQPLASADLVIAATASVHEFIVVTRDVRHFERIPGLQVEDWFPVE